MLIQAYPDGMARMHCQAKYHQSFGSQNLEEIAQNARALVENEFTYEAAVERYVGVFSTLNIGEGEGDKILKDKCVLYCAKQKRNMQKSSLYSCASHSGRVGNET